MMKITYDKDADAAYIQFVKYIKNGGVKKTIELKEGLYVDYDENNKMLGLEVLDASKVLTKQALEEAQTA